MNYINPAAKITPVHHSLWEMSDVFLPEFFNALPSYYNQTRWNMDRALSRLSWPCFPYDNNIDPLQQLGTQMAQLVGQALSCDVGYTMAKLFLDLPGSCVPLHHDADRIDIMAQVYITQTDWPMPGTVFEQPWPHTVQYRYNCGYFNLNQDRKLHHSGEVAGVCRSSVGFQLYFAK